ncbi:MAG TPA: DUF4912 domain-containing protein [Candidatus Binatia bacterium]|nr:DUF4912 domain-containing protein [Candidatus Binatia bacterium]
MIAAALGSGFELVGGWVGCAVGLLRRLGAPLLVGPRDVEHERVATPAAPWIAERTSDQDEVEGAKYYLGPADEAPPRAADTVVDRETGELPRSYGRDRIVLLPRDPWWAFTYWEITPTTRVQGLRALGADAEGAREILRVYDVTFITFTGDNAWLSFDVHLPPGAEHWYLNVGRPAASFCIEIGLRTRSGRFLPLARSNTATTPRSAPSPDTTVRWVDVGRGPGAVVETTGPGPVVGLADGNGGSASPDERSRSSDVHAPQPR